jgi:DNA-binding SARP family transcriptional activator
LASTRTDAPVTVVAAKVRIPPLDSYGLVRLDALMGRLWSRRLGLIVAPAGSGKTTLMARFATTSGVPTAWYRSESWDVSEDHLLRNLEKAFAGMLGDSANSWLTVEDAATALERKRSDRLLLVIDDAHAIAGTSAERALERFIDYAPPGLLTLVASRTPPNLNLSRLRVSGALAEITGEDLRFRSWEVENLFREFYREPLPPVELADLARRTEGWAAGLQLFHLATSGKSPAERQRILRALGGGSKPVREYLARNVLDELPASFRRFLIDSCVLGRLSGRICDRFLNRTDSGRLLQELERRQIFTTALGDGGDYRYHEVLRSHLEHVLVGEMGEAALRVRYHDAGAVLEEHGAMPEAVHAYCRAEDWASVDRILGGNGAQLAQGTGVWIDALPPAILEHDPWLLLASARRHRAEGSWQTAVETYQRAERGFGSSEAVAICLRERQSLASWLTAAPARSVDGLGQIRLAVSRDPLAIRAQQAGQTGAQEMLVGGVASLLAGEVLEARRLLTLAGESPDASDVLAAGAHLAASVAAILAGDRAAIGALELAVENADSLGQGFLARLGRAFLALDPVSARAADAAAVQGASHRLGDRWGAAAAALVRGWNAVLTGDPDAVAEGLLNAVADEFHSIGAAVLEAWARALVAVALSQKHDAGAHAAALRAEVIANTAGVEGARLFVYLALVDADSGHREQYVRLAEAVQARTGLSADVVRGRVDPPGAKEPPITIRCFGEFRVTVNGRPLAMKAMKPRTRALLRRLSADAGSPVHREVLEEALWPEADGESSARNLHVAISSLRQALEPGVARGASSLLVREGDSYRLFLPPGSEVDLHLFERELETCRNALAAGDLDVAIQAFRHAAEVGLAQLLPEDGSAPWIVHRRQRARTALLEASQRLARVLVTRAKPSAAIEVCVAGLIADRYDDALWRLLIEAREEAGDRVAARRDAADYRAMLSELGIGPTGS